MKSNGVGYILFLRGVFIILFSLNSLLFSAEAIEPCVKCLSDKQSKRWDKVNEQIVETARLLKLAKKVLRKAEAKGDQAIIDKARRYLEDVKDNWSYVNALGDALTHNSYESYQDRRLVDTEKRYEQAKEDFKKTTEILDGIRKAQGETKKRLYKELEGIAIQREKQRLKLAIDSALGGIGAAAHKASLEVMLLKKLPTGVIDYTPRIDKLEKLIKLNNAIKAGKTGYNTWQGKYWDITLDAAQEVLGLVIPTALSSEHKVFLSVAAQNQLNNLTAFPFFLNVGLDFVDIAWSHEEFYSAERRLDNVRNTELHWQVEWEIAKSRVKYLEEDRLRIEENIKSQEILKKQLKQIRSEIQ